MIRPRFDVLWVGEILELELVGSFFLRAEEENLECGGRSKLHAFGRQHIIIWGSHWLYTNPTRPKSTNQQHKVKVVLPFI